MKQIQVTFMFLIIIVSIINFKTEYFEINVMLLLDYGNENPN